MSDQTGEAQKRQATNPTVQFIDALPPRTRTPSNTPRKSKYDAVYEMLQTKPGHWAYIGEGKNLHGSLAAYKKRRELDDLKIAIRGDSVFAGYQMPDTPDEDAGDSGATATATPGEDPFKDDADGQQTEGDGEAISGHWTGSESAVTAGNSEGEAGSGWA